MDRLSCRRVKMTQTKKKTVAAEAAVGKAAAEVVRLVVQAVVKTVVLVIVTDVLADVGLLHVLLCKNNKNV